MRYNSASRAPSSPALPAADHLAKTAAENGGLPWTEEAGRSTWYLYDLAGEKIVDDPTQIIDLIRCAPDTPRHCAIDPPTLAASRGKVEKHIQNTYLKSVQAPIGIKPMLKAWMELSSG